MGSVNDHLAGLVPDGGSLNDRLAALPAGLAGTYAPLFDNDPVRLGTADFVYKIVDLGGGEVLAAVGSTSGDVWRSTDYGYTWALLKANAGGASILHDLIHLGDGILLGATDNVSRIARSTDYGATWADAAASPQLSASLLKVNCLCDLGSGVVLAGTYDPAVGSGQVFKSSDYGATWGTGVALGNAKGVDVIIDLGGGVVIAGSQENTTTSGSQWWRSTDSGASFTQIATAAGVNVTDTEYGHCGTVLSDGSVVIGTYGGGTFSHIYRSTDDGVNWDTVAAQDFVTLNGIQGLFWIEELEPGLVLAGTGIQAATCRLWMGADYGRRWSEPQSSFAAGDAGIVPTHVTCITYLGEGVALLGMGTSGEIRRVRLSPRAGAWIDA